MLHKELENNNVVMGNRRSGSALTPYHLLSKVSAYQDYTSVLQALSRRQMSWAEPCKSHCAKPTLHRSALLPLQVLEDACCTHAATYAHRDHAIVCIAPLHFMHELDGEFRTSRPHRVAEGDSSSVDVELIHVYT